MLRQALNRARSRMKSVLDAFERQDISPGRRWRTAASIFAGWAIPAACFVVAVEWASRYRDVEYLRLAITEGIGPALWNVVGVFGAALFGCALLFPGATWIAFVASQAFVNCYAIGTLSFGLIAGQLLAIMACSM